MLIFDKKLFLEAVTKINVYPLDEDQEKAVLYDCNKPLFLVAGPGTGKTTVLTFRILKFVFMDGITPNRIIATTFTVKAANELRSRILDKGILMTQYFQEFKPKNSAQEDLLMKIDFNQIKTGTLDSIAEKILTDYRTEEELKPVIIDDFISKALILRNCVFKKDSKKFVFKREDLKSYLFRKYRISSPYVPKLRDFILSLYNKIIYDRVDLESYVNNIGDLEDQQVVKLIHNLINTYKSVLRKNDILDFAQLEDQLLAKLKTKDLEKFIEDHDILLVDEYQDTNYLQEQIYFNIIKKIRQLKRSEMDLESFAPLTVVGDDDQSLYRFRGSTVQLFKNFKEYLYDEFKITSHQIPLQTNYRSSRIIINFYNQFLKLDENYIKNARVDAKEFVNNDKVKDPPESFPILYMFRDDVEILSKDLAEFLFDIFRGSGRFIEFDEKKYKIIKSSNGDLGDAVLLISSPREITMNFGKITYKLPFHLRRDLEEVGIKVFNPRGETVSDNKKFSILCGIILKCLDDDYRIQESEKIDKVIKDVFYIWRNKAVQFIQKLVNNGDNSLNTFVNSWVLRLKSKNQEWDIPLLDLVYNLTTWIPYFLDDPEGHLYLELLNRTITRSASYATFGGKIVKSKNYDDDTSSISEIYWNIFVPIAAGEIEINEDLIEDFPRDRYSILSIHQSKGLEFPMVIVDVGSQFKGIYVTQAFKRFPQKNMLGLTYSLEQQLRKYSAIKEFVENRDKALDRAFDDLIRHYYVAYSRTQEILLLVGLNQNFTKEIPNMALGWNRESKWEIEKLKKIPWVPI